ncbi:unnamed protein product [Schistosoma margrebowiei]|uniref:Uncharacterized protein n=1 Tax=Schistosoma margrebowiei TaxID=48269 RepID=A0A183LMF9_9TREM|nr:unnamed protein product [Schistosoma margrebowiei]
MAVEGSRQALVSKVYNVILRELVLPTSQSQTLPLSYPGYPTVVDQSSVGICACCTDCLDIALNHKLFKQIWIVASIGIQDVCFVLFGTRQLDVPLPQTTLHGNIDLDYLPNNLIGFIRLCIASKIPL